MSKKIIEKKFKYDITQPFYKTWANIMSINILKPFLINLFNRPSRVIANNWFGKKIILFNKTKVWLLANIKSELFFKKIIVLNVISLQKCKKVILHIISII